MAILAICDSLDCVLEVKTFSRVCVCMVRIECRRNLWIAFGHVLFTSTDIFAANFSRLQKNSHFRNGKEMNRTRKLFEIFNFFDVVLCSQFFCGKIKFLSTTLTIR